MASFTKSELMQKLRELHDVGLSDPEMAHSEADNFLVRYLNDPEITAAYGRIRKC
ncbi:Uncharacterised protein [Mycobacteroides abscessus subsp. bolletii]|nr:Uncharacterised protein [Mycobacteroides abscessus]SKF41686.1 Uncharacterised protein [Mycobacteroides abscessus subsp. bolletii]SKH18395.1 Uncharacterised protein [Mycobacteroides abscessus subsp. bolletii]